METGNETKRNEIEKKVRVHDSSEQVATVFNKQVAS